jgi:hypothetical protein
MMIFSETPFRADCAAQMLAQTIRIPATICAKNAGERGMGTPNHEKVFHITL